MNCRPGDIAVIVAGGKYCGRLVAVLCAAPSTAFKLPDGFPHDPCPPASWVFEFLGAKGEAPIYFGQRVRLAQYAVTEDRFLRPLRDSDGADEMLRIAGLPREVVA